MNGDSGEYEIDRDQPYEACEWLHPIPYCIKTDLDDPTNCLQCDSEHFYNCDDYTCDLCVEKINNCLSCNNDATWCNDCYMGHRFDY